MVKDKTNFIISLKDFKDNFDSQKALFECIAAWMSDGKKLNIRFVGGDSQIKVIKRAILETKKFQDELFNDDTTLEEVFCKLSAKHSAAAEFEKVFGVSWAF